MDNSLEWKSLILQRLKERKEREQKPYEQLVLFCSRLFESMDSLRNENLILKMSQHQSSQGSTGSIEDQKKLFMLQEQLTELHRSRGENAQQIVSLRNTLEDREREMKDLNKKLELKDDLLKEKIRIIDDLKTQVSELNKTKESLNDEYTALHMAFVSLEQKHLNKEKEFSILLERYIALKASQADLINAENEAAFEMKRRQQEKALALATKEENISVDDNEGAAAMMLMTSSVMMIPTKKSFDFEAHEAEVNALGFLGHQTLLTGGGDRRVKAWELDSNNDKAILKTIFSGSNAAITSIDTEGSDLILASSNDFASRVWSVDGKLRRTLTGHSNKVMSAKFLSSGNRVVSGSHDRTLKIWDLNRHSCIKTLFAGSSCNDLVVTSSGSESSATVVSGHFDKRIRFWETRTESTCNEILLEGRITSLAIHGYSLLTCVRDDSLKQLDLRMNSVVRTFVADNFKVGCDWTRASFSADGSCISCGSTDGVLFVWNLLTGRIESILKDSAHSGHNIISCAWSPSSPQLKGCLISGDRSKRVVVWVE